MVEYTCERCHYTTHLKSDLVKHLNKKVPCVGEFSDKDVLSIVEDILKPKEYVCYDCNKSFSYNRNLVRHRKEKHPPTVSVVNENSNNTDNSNSHNASESNNTEHSHNNTHTEHSHNTTTTTNNTHSHNTTNNNTTNNIHNPTININLNIFGKEELDHILKDENLLLECLKNARTTGVQKLIQKIWCNDEVPQNQNVQLKREHRPKMVSVYTKEDNQEPQWVEKNAEIIIDQMIEKGTNMLIMYNNKLYRLHCEDACESDEELHDIRTRTLADIRTRKRGYGKFRDLAIGELRKMKKTNKHEFIDTKCGFYIYTKI
jgi:hypothetical protein